MKLLNVCNRKHGDTAKTKFGKFTLYVDIQPRKQKIEAWIGADVFDEPKKGRRDCYPSFDLLGAFLNSIENYTNFYTGEIDKPIVKMVERFIKTLSIHLKKHDGKNEI